jgi:ligand-binding sensor domain-containing protein
MKRIVLAVTLAAATAVFAQESPSVPPAPTPTPTHPRATDAESVSELGTHIMCIHEAKDSTLWFGSDAQGVYRSDGKSLMRFTTDHGLTGNSIRSIQEDRSGNILVFADPGVVCRFDGRGFHRVPVLEPSKCEWKIGPDDLWFPAGQDTGAVFRWDGERMHRLTFPTTAAGDAHYAELPRSKFPNAKYSPYDVYTIFKDSKGRMWFGTALLGACRYDGVSFVWVGHNENGSFGVRAIVEDEDGKFWLSTTESRFAEVVGDGAEGACVYRREKGVATADDPYSAFVSSVRGKDGALWLAILGGLVCRFDGRSWTEFPVKSDGKHIWLTQIYQDREGRLWVGTQGKGVYRFDGTGFARVEFDSPSSGSL